MCAAAALAGAVLMSNPGGVTRKIYDSLEKSSAGHLGGVSVGLLRVTGGGISLLFGAIVVLEVIRLAR